MSITKGWVDGWHDHPADVVLIDSATDTQWTGAQMVSATSNLAAHMRTRGVASGDRVAFACGPSGAAAIAYIAILRLGATVVAINPQSTASELKHFVALAQPRLAICDEQDGWSIETLAPDAHGGDALADVADLDVSTSDAVAIICFTSGTTGNPKGVPLTHGNLAAGMAGLQRAWEWTASDVLVSALPIFHIHGLIVALSTSLDVGGTIVLEQRFDPSRVVADVERYRATMFFAVPTMWWRLDQAGVVAQIASLRMATSGSAPLDPTLFERLSDALGAAPVERYGMSETSILTSNPIAGERKAGSVGLPLPGIELRLAESGEVSVRGASVITRYLDGASSESFESDGWFRTGDIGKFDGDGYLYLVGRQKDLIISGGHNVAPGEIEDLLRGHDAVNDAAVIGRVDAQWGEVVIAVVTPASAKSAVEELEALCRKELAGYKRPRQWHFADELPRNSMGKIQRHRIVLGTEG